MANVEILCKNVSEPDWIAALRDFADDLLSKSGRENWDLSIVLCDDEFIRDLNLQFRGIDEATDILSFENGTEYCGEKGETRIQAGDIVLSLPFMRKNCDEFAVTPNEELKRLVIHGVLHLSGRDHSSNDFAVDPMLKEQEQILAAFSDVVVIA